MVVLAALGAFYIATTIVLVLLASTCTKKDNAKNTVVLSKSSVPEAKGRSEQPKSQIEQNQADKTQMNPASKISQMPPAENSAINKVDTTQYTVISTQQNINKDVTQYNIVSGYSQIKENSKPKAREVLPDDPVANAKRIEEIKKGKTVQRRDPLYRTMTGLKSSIWDSTTKSDDSEKTKSLTKSSKGKASIAASTLLIGK